MPIKKLNLSFFFLLILCSSIGTVVAQEVIQGAVISGEAGITVSAEKLQQQSDAIGLPARRLIAEELETRKFHRPVSNPASPRQAFFPFGAAESKPQPNNITQSIHSNFQGIGLNESGFIPPDNMGDVGTTQICIAGNGRLKFYNKSGLCQSPLSTSTTNGSVSLGNPAFNVDLDVFFDAVRGGFETTDPRVHFDRLSGRWFIVCINVATSKNKILIAVSNGPTVSAQSNFTFYSFAHDQGTSSGQNDYNGFCDYPMMGLDKNALYIGGVIFSAAGSYLGSSCYVVNKAALISGAALNLTAFRRAGSASFGIFIPQGVSNDDPAATKGFFIGTDATEFGTIRYMVISDPGGSPTAAQYMLTVPSTAFPINQTASGSASDLDGGSDDRLVNAILVRNKIDGRQSIFASHAIGVKADGIADENAPDRNGERWYEFSIGSSSLLTLRQSGTLFDNATNSPSGYFMGSIGGSGQGHAVLGASIAGSSSPVNVAVSGRYNNQTLGELSPALLATNFSESYNAQTGETQRWGDYSQTVCDPGDDMTIWTFQQYTNTNNSWGIRAIQLKAPPPATPIQMTALSCNATRTVEVNLTGQSTSFSGFFDPGEDVGGPGFTNRLQVSSTGNVIITNTKFTSPTQIAFTLNYANATSGTQQTLTITNPDCQSVTYNYAIPSNCAALPVKWLDITANWQGNQAKIEWKVAEEKNTMAYIIEKSKDAKNFETLNRLGSNGQQGIISYSAIDLQPATENFYRIKQVDKDGSISYSAVVALSRKTIAALSVSPNPARQQIRVFLPKTTGMVRLTDLSGKLILSKTATSNFISFDVEGLSRGVYLVEYLNQNLVERTRVVLQ